MVENNWRIKYPDQINAMTSSEFATLVDLHSGVAKATFLFFDNKGMQYVPVPGTTGSASSPMEPGSDSEPVEIQIQNRKTLLTDSAQFHLEYACRTHKNGCFYYGHSFRDEEPDDRHLAQFSHAEAEILGTLENVKHLVENYLKYLTEFIWKKSESNLKNIPGIYDRINHLLKSTSTFRSLSFSEACKILKGYDNVLKECEKGGFRLTPKGERILLEKLGDFIWIEHWDKMTVPFYQANENGIAFNADLLFGIGEVVGAGQRHVNAEDLKNSLDEHGLPVDDYKWYFEMKQYYPLQTSGFGMGVERYLMWLLGLENIRSVEVFSRNRFQKGEI